MDWRIQQGLQKKGNADRDDEQCQLRNSEAQIQNSNSTIGQYHSLLVSQCSVSCDQEQQRTLITMETELIPH